MSNIMDEFEFLIEEQEQLEPEIETISETTDSDVEDNHEFDFLLHDSSNDTSFQEDSASYIEMANKFLSNKNTYQGLQMQSYIDCISIGHSDIMPWEHVKFTINSMKLKDISGHRAMEFSIPSFVEEVESIGDKDGTEFGYNQYGMNNLRFINIPYSVTVIAPLTFALYKKLEVVNFAENSSLIYIGSQAFVGCESLKILDLRNCIYLDTIQDKTFNSSGIEVLKISSSIQKICSLDNTNIKTVYIDDDKYSIAEYNKLMSTCNDEVFWKPMDYNF